jgi:hypothetical protein
MNRSQRIDYSGRTVDLLLLKTVLAVPVVNKRVGLDVSNVVDEPMIVSGVEKMVQRYAIAFINAIGSTKFRQDHGTEIVPMVSAGMVYSMATLESVAAEANLLAGQQIMMADEGEETPDDEKLVSSDIVDLEFSRERSMVRISVRLTTAAGDSYVYIIPVGVGVH